MCSLALVCWCHIETCVPAHLCTQSPTPEAQQDRWKPPLTAIPALHPWGQWLTSAPAVSPILENASTGCAAWCLPHSSLMFVHTQQQTLQTSQLCQILPFPDSTAIWTQGSGALWTIPTWIHWFKLRINIPEGRRDCGLDPSSFHSKFPWRLRCFRVTAPAVHSCVSKGRIDHLGCVYAIQ